MTKNRLNKIGHSTADLDDFLSDIMTGLAANNDNNNNDSKSALAENILGSYADFRSFSHGLSTEPRIDFVALFVYSAMSLMSLAGNLLFVIVICQSTKLHTVTHLLMTNLAISNLGFVILSTPAFISKYIFRWPFTWGQVFCKLSSSGVHLTATASFYAMALVAIDRWLAVFYPHSRLTKRKSFGLTVALWFVALGVASPYLYYSNVVTQHGAHRDSKHHSCSVPVDKLRMLEMPTIIIQYCVPMFIIIPSYSHLCVFLCLKKEIGSQDRQKRAHSRKMKIIVILLLIVVVFVSCWTPLLVITALIVYAVYMPSFTTFIWVFTLASLAVCLTPFLYMFNDNFRYELVSLFNCGVAGSGQSSRLPARLCRLLCGTGHPDDLSCAPDDTTYNNNAAANCLHVNKNNNNGKQQQHHHHQQQGTFAPDTVIGPPPTEPITVHAPVGIGGNRRRRQSSILSCSSSNNNNALLGTTKTALVIQNQARQALICPMHTDTFL